MPLARSARVPVATLLLVLGCSIDREGAASAPGLELTQARLLVQDLPGARRFYTEIIGLDVGFENAEYVELSTATGVSIGLYGRDAMAQAIGNAEAETPRGRDRSVVVFRVSDVDSAAEQLRARGASQVAEPIDRPDWNLRTAHFRDPEGNLIELIGERRR